MSKGHSLPLTKVPTYGSNVIATEVVVCKPNQQGTFAHTRVSCNKSTIAIIVISYSTSSTVQYSTVVFCRFDGHMKC